MFVSHKGNLSRVSWVDPVVQIELTDKAAAVIRRRGGIAVIDFLEPYG